jgi:hypothetical protein
MVLASVAAMMVLRSMVTAAPGGDSATTLELLIAAFIVLAGLPGIGLLVEGPTLFGPMDRPHQR